MNAIDQLRANAKNAKDRPMQIHDLLEDFSSLLDEIEDNIEMYASHKADMRKGLILLIEANSEWQLKLRRLKEQSPPEELDQYSLSSWPMRPMRSTIAATMRARNCRSRMNWRSRRS